MYSIIKISEDAGVCKSCKLASVFESKNNTFFDITAQVIYSITITSPFPRQVRIRTISTVFTYNKAKKLSGE